MRPAAPVSGPLEGVLGERTRAVLAELGLAPEAVETLLADVVAVAEAE